MSYQLKVKYLSLVAEARIIRQQEIRRRKASEKMKQYIKGCGSAAKAEEVELDRDILREERLDLRAHRWHIMKGEARSTHLARMFLKGTPYRACEREGSSTPDWKRILEMARKYGPKGSDFDNLFTAWKDAEKVVELTPSTL